METGTCDRCKWWGNVLHEYDRYEDADDGISMRAPYLAKHKLIEAKPCGCPKWRDAGFEYWNITSHGTDWRWLNLAKDEVGVTAMEPLEVDLRTGPSFGCVHWEWNGK